MGRNRLSLVLAAATAVLWAAPVRSRAHPGPDPQGVRITRSDGAVVEGELLGFEDGRYRVRTREGTLEEVEEGRVQEILLTGALPLPSPAPGPAAEEEASAALERGDTEAALRKVLNDLDGLQSRRREIGALAARIYQSHLPRLLERRDAAGLSDALRSLPVLLPAEARQDLLARLAERLAEQARTAPRDPFTAAFSEHLARLVEEGSLSGEVRTFLADHFARQGEQEAAAGNTSAAIALLGGALRLDPSRREALREPLTKAAVEDGRRRLSGGDPAGALAAAREALSFHPEHEPARKLLEEAEFELLRKKAEAAPDREAEALLKDFLARSVRPDQRAWAQQALARLTARPPLLEPEAQEDLDRYFPLKPGWTLIYRRLDGEIRQKVRIDSVTRTKEGLRARCTLEEVFHGSTAARSYELEVEKGALLLSTGRDREILLRFPLREGDSWSWRSATQQFRRTVKALGRTVRLGPGEPGRTFENCAVVEFTSTSDHRTLTSRSTYAPGVGLVSIEYLDPDQRNFSLELIAAGPDLPTPR